VTDELDEVVQDLLERREFSRASAAVGKLVALLPADLRASAADALRELLPAVSTTHGTPVVALRDLVCFPAMENASLFIGRTASLAAIEAAVARSVELLLVTQRVPAQPDPGCEDLYQVGTLASIVELLRMPDGTVKVVLAPRARTRIRELVCSEPYLAVEHDELTESGPDERTPARVEAVRAELARVDRFTRGRLGPVDDLDARALADKLSASFPFALADKQALLELDELDARLVRIAELLASSPRNRSTP
jgi:ATP-dependent Lon protease